jgi:hypothetical protein
VQPLGLFAWSKKNEANNQRVAEVKTKEAEDQAALVGEKRKRLSTAQ